MKMKKKQNMKFKHENEEVLSSYHIIGTDLSCMRIHAWKGKWKWKWKKWKWKNENEKETEHEVQTWKWRSS